MTASQARAAIEAKGMGRHHSRGLVALCQYLRIGTLREQFLWEQSLFRT